MQEQNKGVSSMQMHDDFEYEEARKVLLFSDFGRSCLVFLSLLTLFPVGIVSLVFWILALNSKKRGKKTNAARHFHDAETMALTSICFGVLAVLTLLMCIPQLKRMAAGE